MSTIIGQKVRLPNSCTCGTKLATVGPGDGKYYCTLTCDCGRSLGSLTEFTGKWIETVAAMFGAPATIVLRHPPIPPIEAESVPSIDGTISNAMNRKETNHGK